MSIWTYINGAVQVNYFGETQAGCECYLKTILKHLPKVTGSEGNMDVYTIQTRKHGFDLNCEDFKQTYLIVVHAQLRDRDFEQTLKEFTKWITRLNKKIDITDMSVNIYSFDKNIQFNHEFAEKLFESRG